jgi:hypothetical protein
MQHTVQLRCLLCYLNNFLHNSPFEGRPVESLGSQREGCKSSNELIKTIKTFLFYKALR